MPLSTDDFDEWAGKSKPPPSAHSNPAAADAKPQIEPDLTGMPTFARLRLREHVANPRAPFTTNLSVNELLLSRSLGYRPIAQVAGASVYHVGWQWMPSAYFAYASELTVQTHAHSDAWRLAVSRLEQQARAAGAHTVVGVRVGRRGFDARLNLADSAETSPEVIEVLLEGTAVRFHGAATDAYDGTSEHPLLSSLSGQEFFTLRAAGYSSAGIAYGCCAYYQPSYWSTLQGSRSTVLLGTQWQNQELTDFTQGLSHARHLAVQRLHDSAMASGANGVLGVTLSVAMREIERDVNDQKQVGLVILFEAFGTAVIAVEKEQIRPSTEAVVSLAG